MSAPYNECMAARAQILVIEDDDDLRNLLVDYLGERGFAVASVGGGSEALAYLESNPRPDVIVLDMKMAPMSGWEFLDHKRTRPQLEDVPVVAASASQRVDSAPLPGVTCAFAKPLDVDALVDTLARLVRH